MCSLIPLFKATWSKGVWKQAGTSNCPPGFVCCFLSQQAARLKLALRRAKMRCNLVVIWPFNLPWDERERGRVCQSMGTVPMWSRSLLPRGWSYDQRDSGALDFLEQALRDAPGLLQQLWHPLRLPCRLIKLTADTRSRGGLFFFFFYPGFSLLLQGAKPWGLLSKSNMKWGPVVKTNPNASWGNSPV